MTQTDPGPAAADPLAALGVLPGVAEAVAASRAAVDTLRGHKVLRSRTEDVAAESVLRGARASAALAGADWALEELRRRTEFGGERGSAAVLGALRATGEVATLIEVFRRAPAQALTRLHMLAAAGEAAPERIGRPRLPGDPVVLEPGSLETVEDAQDAAARLTTLSALLTAPSGAPALVVAAIAYGELQAAAPFGTADGIVARAVFRLVIASRGLDPGLLAAPEAGFVELGLDARRAALAAYASGTSQGLAQWIAHCGEALRLGAVESLAVCESLMRG